MNVHWPIIRRCLAAPRRIAVVDDQRSTRAIEILVGAMHVAAEVERLSATKTVGVLLPTSGAFPIAALGAWIAGRTVVPLNYLLKPDELQYVVDDCDTDLILSAGALLDRLEAPPRGVTIRRMEDIHFRAMPDLRWPDLASDEDLALLLYTSGTSGRPKGVMLTHANLSANIRQVVEWAGLANASTMLGVLPQFHTFGMTVLTLVPLTLGLKVVYSARFVPAKIIKLFREHRPDLFVGIPSMYNALLSAKDATPEDFAHTRFLVSGGEPLPDAVAERFFERFGARIAEGFGMTECSPVTHWCRPHEYRPHSVGPAVPDVRTRIVDINTGEDLPPGREGELRIAGPNIMRGYYKLPDKTAEAFDERGYLRTGDMAKLDADGHLFITGRLKEMLIVGGENVFPREIEEVINRHPAVADSGVVGLQDPVRGEVPIAFVELRDGAEFDEQALIAHCRQHLAGYKAPREVRPLDALPRNPTGKILRRDLVKLLTEPQPAPSA